MADDSVQRPAAQGAFIPPRPSRGQVCSVRHGTPHSSGFARLVPGSFYEAVLPVTAFWRTGNAARRILSRGFSCFILVLLLAGCPGRVERAVPVPVPSARPLALSPDGVVPPLLDDLNGALLEKAIESSLQYYGKLPAGSSFLIGDTSYTLEEMKNTLRAFREIIRSPDPAEVKDKKIRGTFDLYKSAGGDGMGTVLFTGYFEPILEGSREKTERFRYPIYGVPQDTVVVNLGKFREKLKNERIVGRLKNDELIPYHSRAEIDGAGVLGDRNLEIVWVDDPVELFFLHIQGSGTINLPDGSSLQVSYARDNGRSYRSVANYLLNGGKLSARETSHQFVKKYLKDHPEELADTLNYNESYVFFRIVGKGPVGSLGFPVIAGRSVATDAAVFPRGALAFMTARKPVFDGAGNIVAWVPFSRFVLSQDAGGVIKGPGRVDLFCGTGDAAELLAGSLKEKGELYFLVKKR
jgi:membrane-bound lytic murein transglycosylase A